MDSYNQYVQIVHSYRENGKVKHEVLLNLERLDVVRNSPRMKRFVKRINEILNVDMVEVEKLKDAEILN